MSAAAMPMQSLPATEPETAQKCAANANCWNNRANAASAARRRRNRRPAKNFRFIQQVYRKCARGALAPRPARQARRLLHFVPSDHAQRTTSSMNYRHAFHAGNFADVFKHAILTGLIESLKAKQTPFHYFD